MAEYLKINSVLPKKRDPPKGTTENPVLLEISRGQRTEESLLFSHQIGKGLFQSRIEHQLTTKSTITLHCAEKGKKRCMHRMKLRVKKNDDLLLGTKIQRFPQNAAPYTMTKYKFDVKNEECRKIENYEVLEIESENHNHPPTKKEAILKCQFKENAVKRSIDAARQQFDEEKIRLPQSWCSISKGRITGDARYEKKLIRERLSRRFNAPAEQIPDDAKTITVPSDPFASDFDFEETEPSQFLQFEDRESGITIWILEFEMNLLHDDAPPNGPEQCVSIDGTFNCVSRLPGYKQQYSLVRYYTSDDRKKGLAYPIAFFWLRDKKLETYQKAFTHLKEIYFQVRQEELEISTWRIDFEPNPFKVIRQLWPACEICGCQFHFAKCLNEKWQQKLSRKKWVFDENLRRRILAVYRGMPFVSESVFLAALEELESKIIPDLAESTGMEDALMRFHNYFLDFWIAQRDKKADFNHFDMMRRGNKTHTTNASEALHSSLGASYRVPPSTVKAAARMLHSYKSDLLSKFNNKHFVPRMRETLDKEELIQFHHLETEKQSEEWKIENAVDICRQFTYLEEEILQYPLELSQL